MNIKIPKTLHNLCVGDIVIDLDNRYMKVLGVINQNCYVMSRLCNNLDTIMIEYYGEIWTIKQLEFYECKPYTKRLKKRCS